MTGCQSGDATSTTTGSGDQPVVVLIGKTTDEHFALACEGALAAGEEFGVTVDYKGPDTSNEGDRQLNMLESAINSGAAGIALAPQDGVQDSAPGAIASAGDIPIVISDTPLAGSDIPIQTISSNNTGIGEHLAEKTAEALGGKGTVAMITNGIVGTAAERRDGFTNWMAANAPGITVVTIQDGEADPAKSRDKAVGILQANPDLDALVGTGNYSTLAISDEVAARGSDTLVFGVDAGPDILSQIEAGNIDGIVAQNPYGIGYQTVEVLAKAINGELPAEKLAYTDSAWVTKDNMNDPEMQKILGTG